MASKTQKQAQSLMKWKKCKLKKFFFFFNLLVDKTKHFLAPIVARSRGKQSLSS